MATDSAPPHAEAPDPADDAPSAVEEAAQRQFGLRLWERPALYRETAVSAVDTDLPFFLVLLLSGAIATLGLVLNSTAVVIGAMLVAPLLGPLLGLSLSIAVGDGRLFLQTAAAVLLGAAGVVALAALLTLLLPFQSVTDEIAARTRPTTLDLLIAVFSGLAGAVVTASRETRLSASIPGVAVAVALVPPLGVAGFGVAMGRWAFVQGALLLFGANLAGIVLSGMAVFLLIGMHRKDVVETAREWHQEEHATGVARAVGRMRLLDRMPLLASPLARLLLVASFMAIVAVPLTRTLSEVIRESRIGQAVDGVVSEIQAERGAFVIDRDVIYGDGASTVRLRIATQQWLSQDAEARLTRQLTEGAGEPVTLEVDQVLASTGDLKAFADALPSRPAVRTTPVAPKPASVATVRGRLADVLQGLALPDSVRVVGGQIQVSDGEAPLVEVAYGARRRLPPEAEAVIARQAARALGLPDGAGRIRPVLLAPRPLPDSAAAPALAGLLRRYPRLGLSLAGDSAEVARSRARLAAAGAPAGRIRAVPDSLAPRARLTLAPDSAAAR